MELIIIYTDYFVFYKSSVYMENRSKENKETLNTHEEEDAYC